MATESEKIDDDFRRLTAEIDELNADLCELEEEIGLPSFYRSKPIPERLAHVGFPNETIKHVKTKLDAWAAVREAALAKCELLSRQPPRASATLPAAMRPTEPTYDHPARGLQLRPASPHD